MDERREFGKEGSEMHELGPLFACLLIGFIAWLVFTSIRRFLMARLQATLQAKLLERINSPETLLTYVSTDAGREFVEALRLEREREPRTAPFRSILIGVQLSIVLIVFGGALLLLHATHTLPDDVAMVMGTLPIALGIGLGIAAAATYALSRSFGLVENNRRS
jgi:hypothetical protein